MSTNQQSAKPRVVLIGGGTGSFTLLQGLKKANFDLSALVNMSDDGGSTGKLRGELGVLPPGDVRQCLVALSEIPDVRDLFNYRFGQGSLAGQSLGNIILSGLELQKGSFNEAIKVASSLLRVQGRVVPITLTRHTLIMADGAEIIKGESRVMNHRIKQPSVKLWLEPKAEINPEAKTAISEAELILIAPGDLYGSLLPALIVDGVQQSLKGTAAKVVLITSLVNKPIQTLSWHVMDYLNCLERYIGKDQIDYVIYNNREPSPDLLRKYASKNEFPVEFGKEQFKDTNAKIIGSDLVAKKIFYQNPNDKTLKRTLIRHDADQVTRIIKEILNNK